MTTLKTFEENIKKVFSFIKENFDSIGAGEEECYGDLNTTGYIAAPLDIPPEDGNDSMFTSQTEEVPIEKPPKFRIYWRGWKDGNNTSGQTESVLDTAQMARAESMTKLYDLGFNDIEILAIETIKSVESETI